MDSDRLRDYYDGEAKERQKRKPKDSVKENLPEQKKQSRDAAGAAVGVSGKLVDAARLDAAAPNGTITLAKPERRSWATLDRDTRRLIVSDANS